jgi:hypothetical protein
VSYQSPATVASAAGTNGAGLLLISPDAAFDGTACIAHLDKGGKAFFLPRSQADGWLGVTLTPAAARFGGSLSVPEWPEARGLPTAIIGGRREVIALGAILAFA